MKKECFLSAIIIAMLLATPAAALFQMEGQLSGNMVASNGSVVSGSLVTATDMATGDKFTAETDSSGNFAIEVPPGMYKITYTSYGEEHTHGTVVVADGLTVSISIQVSADSDVMDEDSGSITGKITTSAGVVVSDALVSATNTETGAKYETTTDTSGSFSISAPVGVYDITYEYEGNIYTYDQTVTVGGEATISIDLQISGIIPKSLEIKAPNVADVGEVAHIKVIDRMTRELIKDSEVYISGTSVDIGKTSASLVIKYGEFIGKTDENGEITHAFNEAGKYIIAASKDGYLSDDDYIIIKSRHLQPPVVTQGRNTGFNVSGSYIIEYSVQGTGFFSSVDVDTNISTEARTGVKSRFETEKLRISAHDNANGLLKFKAEKDTSVTIELSDSASIEKESDKKITVRSDEMEGTLMIAGQGHLSVEDGTITVELERNSQLIFKAYPREKDSGDEDIEDGIISGDLSAEIQVLGDGAITDSVEYSTEVEITSTSVTEEGVSVAVDSATEIGKTIVIIIDNSELPADPGELSVKVDGEATVEASSTGEVYATGTSDKSKSVVVKGETNTKVFVYVNHFSQRIITIGEDKDTPPDELESKLPTEAEESTEAPGFESIFVIVGFLAVAYILRRRE